MLNLSFTLNVIPTPQARPRHAVICGHARTYKTKDQQENEQTLAALLAPYQPDTPAAGPVVVSFTAYMPIPKSTTKKRMAALEHEQTLHTKKPDSDNLIKNLLDVMTKLQFWKDDNLVAELHTKKVYSPRPRWEICVQEIEE